MSVPIRTGRPTTTFYCPFCGEETIRPVDPPARPAAPDAAALAGAADAEATTNPTPTGTWYSCESCTRTYTITTARTNQSLPRGGVA